MKRLYSLLGIIFVSCAIISMVNFSFATDRELTAQENAAFIVREEWTNWVNAFTASLSDLDRQATNKIYEDMDFYDMQYLFTEKYKGEEYIDPNTGKRTQKLIDLIKEKRKERNKNR